MAELQGAKVSLNDANTGHVIEFELVRVGTLREFRDLVKANEEREAFDVGAGEKITALEANLATVGRDLLKIETERDEALSKIAGLEESAKTAAMAVEGTAGARDAALAGVDEVARQRDEAKAALTAEQERCDKAERKVAELRCDLEQSEAYRAAMTHQRDTGLATVAQLQESRDEDIKERTLRAVEAERKQGEAEAALALANGFTDAQKEHMAAIAEQIEAGKTALDNVLAELLGAVDQLGN